jgi:hypothetical protein
MSKEDLELLYLRFFYENVDLGENEEDIKKICNASQLEKFNDLAEDFTHLFSKPRHRR